VIEDWRPRVAQAFRPAGKPAGLRYTPHAIQHYGTMFEAQFTGSLRRRRVMLTLVNLVLVVMALVVLYWGLRVLLSRGS
jgi:hypothetical protein